MRSGLQIKSYQSEASRVEPQPLEKYQNVDAYLMWQIIIRPLLFIFKMMIMQDGREQRLTVEAIQFFFQNRSFGCQEIAHGSPRVLT